MYIPENLIRHRILGRYRVERCRCGKYHMKTEADPTKQCPIQYMDGLILDSKYKSIEEMEQEMMRSVRKAFPL